MVEVLGRDGVLADPESVEDGSHGVDDSDHDGDDEVHDGVVKLGDTLHGDGGSILEAKLPGLRSIKIDHSESGKGLRTEGGRDRVGR